MSEENLLRRIRGEDVSRAARALPPCTSDAPAQLEAVITVAEHGQVRITFARFAQRRGKLKRYFWTAERAVRVDAPAPSRFD